MSYTDDLGPLPVAGRSHDLEELGMRAFRDALPVDELEARDERVSDFGVDLSLELKIHGFATNMRSLAQLKSTESLEPNVDGSISLSVPTSNLNYLLNGPAPIYVLYRISERELRFLFAREEEQRIEREAPEWRSQKSVALRFKEPLDRSAIDRIKAAIKIEGTVHRRVCERLADASLDESVTVTIDRHTLDVTDPKYIFELLIKNAFTLAASGYPDAVRKMVELLGPKARSDPHIQARDAYAAFILGRYPSADALCREATLQSAHLGDHERHAIALIMNACAYNARRISYDEYCHREAELVHQGPRTSQLHHRLFAARWSALKVTDVEETRARVRDVDDVVRDINEEGSSSLSLKNTGSDRLGGDGGARSDPFTT